MAQPLTVDGRHPVATAHSPGLAPMITKEVSILLPEAFEQAGKTSLTTLSQLHA
jgi:hypothetical protein